MVKIWMTAGVIAAVVIGIGIVLVTQKQRLAQTGLKEATQNPEKLITAISEASHSAQYLNSLSAEERKVAELDLTNPSTLKDSKEIITAAAKTTAELEIANCEPKPLVYKTRINSTFTIRNSGPKSYNIQTGGGIDVTVPANSSMEVTANFKNGPGTYGYFCGTKPNKGILLVTP